MTDGAGLSCFSWIPPSRTMSGGRPARQTTSSATRSGACQPTGSPGTSPLWSGQTLRDFDRHTAGLTSPTNSHERWIPSASTSPRDTVVFMGENGRDTTNTLTDRRGRHGTGTPASRPCLVLRWPSAGPGFSPGSSRSSTWPSRRNEPDRQNAESVVRWKCVATRARRKKGEHLQSASSAPRTPCRAPAPAPASRTSHQYSVLSNRPSQACAHARLLVLPFTNLSTRSRPRSRASDPGFVPAIRCDVVDR